jgi:hypothetical protein
MSRASDRDAFRHLFREFFAQLFASESAMSDHQVKVAMIGILAFLITPSLFLPVRLAERFELASLRFPLMVDPLTRVNATMFVTFAVVAVGLIAAFEWDALAFDRRDAMVLGPLPVPGRTIVTAKLAALGALLFLASSGINLLTAVTFSLVATTHQPFAVTVRLFAAHLVTTMSASAFVFCSLVTIRATLGVSTRGLVALGTLFQFAMMTALLCFIIFVPSSLQFQWHQVPHHPRQLVGVRMPPIPPWMPTRWFVALYDVIRGSAHQGSPLEPLIAVVLTIGSIAAAVVAVRLGYRQQLRAALAPSASEGTTAAARHVRALARVLAGRRASARGIADFMVATLARNRAQHAPIAMNAALGAAMIVIELTRRGSDFAGLFHASWALSRVPFLLAYWLAVGLRASFFVPSELPAAWTFRTSATEGLRSSHSAIRGATAALLVPPLAILTFVLSALVSDWADALAHATFAALAVLLLVEMVALTVPFIPYARPYESGHAKLKTRWPLYAIGVYLFAYALVRIERAYRSDSTSFGLLLLFLVGTIAALDVIGEIKARQRTTEPLQEFGVDGGRIAVLDLAGGVHRAHAETEV